MKKITGFFLPFLLLFVSYTKAQSISGKIFDSSNSKAIPNAVVAILKPVDSILLKFIRTNKEGNFELKNVPPGKYILMVTHPVYADFVDDITTTAEGLQLNTVKFIPKSQLLQEVFVRTGGAIKIKGDTISYTADSFKVGANANVEELLKKLPGIQVDKNGKITAMGEQVKKVLVDGEEFFGDDPGMAVKNLRADAVKEVQVFDKKSEQAEFTGIDDGQKQKTINLKLKEDKKKGYFGKAEAAAGPVDNADNRYNGNLMLNAFKGKRKISIFSLNGNTGQDGLNWQDNQKYGGENDNLSVTMDEDGGMNWMWRGGNSDEEPNVNTENGFITNNNAGLHYSNKWNDKHSLMISPKYNRQLYKNTETSFTQRVTGKDSTLNDYSTKKQDINRYNFKNNFIYDVKFDSSNSLKLTLKANFYHTDNTENRVAETRDNFDALKNTSLNELKQKTAKNSIYASLIFRHKFKKARRTFSLNAEWNYLNTDGTSYLKSNNTIYDDGSSYNLLKNQLFDFNKNTKQLTSKATYTEPLTKRFAMEFSYELTYSAGANNRTTFNYSPVSGKYDQVVDTLSNHFDQVIVVNKPSARISYNYKKVKFNFGSGFGITTFDLKDLSIDKTYKRNYTNAFPGASFNYTYKPNRSLNFSYNGNTIQPTLNQLQPLRNSDDNFNQYLGNPLLKQSFTHSFNISHNSYNFIKDLWMHQSLNIRSTVNAISNSLTIIADSGKTIIKPVNTDGNISINLWTGFGFKLKKSGININLNPNFNYSKSADIVNGKTTFSKTVNTGMNLWFYKSREKKYDISMGDDFNYYRNITTLNTRVNRYFTNAVTTYVTVYYKKIWSIATDYNFFSRQKTEQFNDNLTNHIWNARLQRTFKSNEFTVYAMIRDILNQNIGIDRSYNGLNTSEITNQRLKRYWMIGFSWDFKNKSGKPETKTPGP